MTTNALSISFGSPEHGWLRVVLDDGSRRVELEASDVPGDSLEMLASAALKIIDGCAEARVEWFLEPAIATWRFRADQRGVELTAKVEGSSPVVMQGGTRRELAYVIWRGMRRLELDPGWGRTDQERVWSHPFPTVSVWRLGRALDAPRT